MAEERRDTRQALIDAGWDALAELRWVDLLPSARSLSDRVGVSTGAFFHHFRSLDHYAVVLARSSLDRIRAEGDIATRLIAELTTAAEAPGPVRTAATSTWQRLLAHPDHDNVVRLLWSLREQPISADTTQRPLDLLAEVSAENLAASTARSAAVLERLGLEPRPPYSMVDISVLLLALTDGLFHRVSVQPDVVRTSLLADAVTAFSFALTRPVGSELGTATDRGLLLGRLDPDALDDPDTEARVLTAATELLHRHHTRDVAVHMISEASDAPGGWILARYGSVEELASVVASRAVTGLGGSRDDDWRAQVAAAADTGGAPPDPLVEIEVRLTALAEWAQAHPWLATALLDARIRHAGTPSRQMPADPGTLLLEPVRALRVDRRLRRSVDAETLATATADCTVLRILLHPNDTVGRVVRETLDLALFGALEPRP